MMASVKLRKMAGIYRKSHTHVIKRFKELMERKRKKVIIEERKPIIAEIDDLIDLTDYMLECGDITEEKAEEVKEMLKEMKKEETKKPKREEKERAEHVGVGKRITLEALDRTQAKVASRLLENVSWFSEAVHNIGFYSTIIALQYAKVDPNEIEQRITQFKDAEEFASFVKKQLSELYSKGGEKARKLLELEEKRRRLEAENAYVFYLTNKIARQVELLKNILMFMWTGACDSCKRNIKWALSFYANMHQKE